MVQAVAFEPVSDLNTLLIGKRSGNLSKFRDRRSLSRTKAQVLQSLRRKFPARQNRELRNGAANSLSGTGKRNCAATNNASGRSALHLRSVVCCAAESNVAVTGARVPGPALNDGEFRGGHCLAPGEGPPFAAPRGSLPFHFGRKPPTPPFAIGQRAGPGGFGDGVLLTPVTRSELAVSYLDQRVLRQVR